jgi:small-conductance mechanosensitive channel
MTWIESVWSDPTWLHAVWLDWLTPVAILAASFFVGLAVRISIMPRLARIVRSTPWEVDDILLKAVQGPVILWTLMAGVYLAMRFSPVPESTVNVLSPILKGLWIFTAAWALAEAAAQIVTIYAAKWRLPLPATSLTQQLARLVVLALGVLVLLDSLGVRIATVLAALGIGSLAVALGLQDTLANLFAGVYVTLSDNIRVGDYVKIDGGQEGYVTDIGWRATKIRMLPNNNVVVPNAKFAQSTIVNYYQPDKELAVLVEVGVDYSSDLERVERVTGEVARQIQQTVPGAVKTFEPFIRYHTFGEFSVNFTVILRGQEFVDQYLIKHEFIKRLHARYAAEGITIPFPVRTIRTVPATDNAD